MISVQRFTLTSTDTHFTLMGTASLRDQRQLNLHADGSLNLKLAETLNPDLTSYGDSKIDVRIAGTVSEPLLSGQSTWCTPDCP